MRVVLGMKYVYKIRRVFFKFSSSFTIKNLTEIIEREKIILLPIGIVRTERNYIMQAWQTREISKIK